MLIARQYQYRVIARLHTIWSAVLTRACQIAARGYTAPIQHLSLSVLEGTAIYLFYIE